MRPRHMYLLCMLIMAALGFGLLFMPFHGSPPTGNSDMQFYGMVLAFFGTIVLGFGAIGSPKPSEPIGVAIFGMAAVALTFIASAYLVAWLP